MPDMLRTPRRLISCAPNSCILETAIAADAALARLPEATAHDEDILFGHSPIVIIGGGSYTILYVDTLRDNDLARLAGDEAFRLFHPAPTLELTLYPEPEVSRLSDRVFFDEDTGPDRQRSRHQRRQRPPRDYPKAPKPSTAGRYRR